MAEASPLALMGYRVGKTHGLPVRDRRVILDFAFDGVLPTALPKAYRDAWGSPGSRARWNRILGHLNSLADLRESRPQYEAAVRDWREDAAWFETAYRGRRSVRG